MLGQLGMGDGGWGRADREAPGALGKGWLRTAAGCSGVSLRAVLAQFILRLVPGPRVNVPKSTLDVQVGIGDWNPALSSLPPLQKLGENLGVLFLKGWGEGGVWVSEGAFPQVVRRGSGVS